MKLIIAGSRDFENSSEFSEVIFEGLVSGIIQYYNINEIVSGTAKGPDTMGKEYAEKNNIKVSEFPAEWDLYGKRAGMVRNKLMGDYADILLAFWDGKSKGTKHMIDYMTKLGKPVIVERYNQKDNFDEF